MKPTDVRVVDVRTNHEDYLYRTPIKFGGVVLDRVTLLNVTLTVESRAGATATGFGSMPLGNVWAWPSKALSYDQTLAAMKEVAATSAGTYLADKAYGHPVEIGHRAEQFLCDDPTNLSRSLGLPGVIPTLAILVSNSPFDAALHDAYGKMLGRSVYRCYGPDFLGPDLGHFLGAEFAGEALDRYLLPAPRPTMPLYHLVGALDPLTPADVAQPVGDGLPETLGDWIRRDGLTHLKIKLNGDDLAWDIERVAAVDRVAEECGERPYAYSLDFNEKCPSSAALLEFFARLGEAAPRAFGRVQYVEQPTARDLRANAGETMHAAAAIRPVVIDESLLGPESLELARAMGYSGVAFKACKGQTPSLLLAALAQKRGMFRCVQDLTCVGASLVHSAGLAAHIPGVAAIESNGRQYCPAANAGWDDRFPGLFTIRGGVANSGLLTGAGLGAVS